MKFKSVFRTSGPISTKLAAKHPWAKGNKFLQNEALNYHIGYDVLFSLNQHYCTSFAKRCCFSGVESPQLLA